MQTALFPRPRAAWRRLPDCGETQSPQAFQVIKDCLTYGRKTPWQASNRERKRGRDLTWTLRGMPAPEWVVENWPGSATIKAVRCKGARVGKSIDEILNNVSSLRTNAKGLMKHVRDRWSIENSWHWPRGHPTQGRRAPLPRNQRRADHDHAPQPGHERPAARWLLVDH